MYRYIRYSLLFCCVFCLIHPVFAVGDGSNSAKSGNGRLRDVDLEDAFLRNVVNDLYPDATYSIKNFGTRKEVTLSDLHSSLYAILYHSIVFGDEQSRMKAIAACSSPEVDDSYCTPYLIELLDSGNHCERDYVMRALQNIWNMQYEDTKEWSDLWHNYRRADRYIALFFGLLFVVIGIIPIVKTGRNFKPKHLLIFPPFIVWGLAFAYKPENLHISAIWVNDMPVYYTVMPGVVQLVRTHGYYIFATIQAWATVLAWIAGVMYLFFYITPQDISRVEKETKNAREILRVVKVFMAVIGFVAFIYLLARHIP